MNGTYSQTTEDGIRLGTPQSCGLHADPEPDARELRLVMTANTAELDLRTLRLAKRLENVPVACPVKRLSDTELLLALLGRDMSGELYGVSKTLFLKYELDTAKGFGGQLANGQGTDVLVRGPKEQLDAVEADFRQQREQVLLSGYKFKPAMNYRLQFDALDARPGLTYRLTGCLQELDLNIEEFTHAKKTTPEGLYTFYDMRLEVPPWVTPKMMTKLRARLRSLERSAQVKLKPELADKLDD
jgi:hypothetical protein